jgi:DNA modification methylase
MSGLSSFHRRFPMATASSSGFLEKLGKIHHGDCVAWLKELPPRSVNLVFADPPFNIGYEYDVYHDKQEDEQYLAWSQNWMKAVYRVLKDDGAFWLAIGDEYAAELKVEAKKLGFHCRSWVIWYYTFGVNCKYKFSRSHAHLFHFVKDLENCTFRSDDLENRIPSARMLVYGDRRTNPAGRLPDDTWILRPQDLADRFTPDEDTWYFPRVAGTFKERAGFHGCQMPEQLLGRIIRYCSHEGEIVLDPFSGSATTLAVAKKLGRHFLGCELSPDYVARGNQRLDGIRVGDPLDGAPEPKMTSPSTVPVRGKESKNAYQTLLFASEASQQEQMENAYIKGVCEAFRRVHDGFSVDRIVADPELNVRFLEQCEKIGVAGDPRSWNRTLFELRKRGLLAEFPVTRRTELSWVQCDSFLFASEIAWHQMLEEGWLNLDEILLEPSGAAEFDRRAEILAPGYSSLEYRWGALKLRKIAKVARMRAKVLFDGKTRKPLRLREELWERLPETSGVYIVFERATKSPLYAGQSLNVRSRIQFQFRPRLEMERPPWSNDLVVRYFPARPHTPLLISHQASVIRRYTPKYNLRELTGF